MQSQMTLENRALLDWRVEKSQKIIQDAVKDSSLIPLIVNFSGGKDSTVLLDLVQKVTDNFICCYMVSGIQFPESIEYAQRSCEKFGRKLLCSYPSDHKGDFFKRIAKFRFFPTVRRPRCTRDLKVRPQKKMLTRKYGKVRFFKLVGVRRFESIRRSALYRDAPKRNYRRKEYQYGGNDVLVYPIIHWTNQDILEYLHRERIRIEPNPLYEKYGVSGCYWCPFYQPSIYKRIIKQNPSLYDRFIEWEVKLNAPSVNGFHWLRDIKKGSAHKGY